MKLRELTEELEQGPNPRSNPHPKDLPVYDSRGGVSAIDKKQVLELFNGDEEALMQYLRRASHLIAVYQPDGQANMAHAYQQAKQERKKYVLI